MLMLREMLIDSIRTGVPVIAAIMGYRFGMKRNANRWKLLGYTAGGFLGGWLAQALLLKLLEGPKPQLGKLPMAQGQMPAATSAPPPPSAPMTEPLAGPSPSPVPPPAMAGPAPPAVTAARSSSRLGEGVSESEVADTTYDAARKISEGDHVQVRGTLISDAFGGGGSV